VWEAWFALVVAHQRVMAALERQVEAECGFSLAWLEVLYQLSSVSGRRLRMHELARACHTSKSGLTRLVDRIETAGLAKRTAIPGDRRSFYVVMTEEGARALERGLPVVRSGLDEHFGRHVRGTEMEPLLSALRRIVAGAARTDPGARDERGAPESP
jgi:DNA-binding MarR family transcriptional regulator